MHAPALFRDTRNPADDVSPSQLADLVPETDWFASLPDWVLPDPPLDLSRHVVTVSLPAIATSDAALRALAERHPAEFAHAQAQVAAKHGEPSPMAWRCIMRYDLKHAHQHVTLGQIDDVIRGLEDAGSEVRVLREGWGGTSVTRWLVIEARTSAVSMIDADVLARARENAGLTYEDVLGETDDTKAVA